jgi:hypothetical protein
METVSTVLVWICHLLLYTTLLTSIIGILIPYSRMRIMGITILELVVVMIGLAYKATYLPYLEPILLYMFYINITITMIMLKIRNMKRKRQETI